MIAIVTSDRFMKVRTLGTFALYACRECYAVVAEDDRACDSPIFHSRAEHIAWHERQEIRKLDTQSGATDGSR